MEICVIFCMSFGIHMKDRSLQLISAIYKHFVYQRHVFVMSFLVRDAVVAKRNMCCGLWQFRPPVTIVQCVEKPEHIVVLFTISLYFCDTKLSWRNFNGITFINK